MVNGGEIGGPSRTDDTRKVSTEIAQRTVADILTRLPASTAPDRLAGVEPDEFDPDTLSEFGDATIEIDVGELTDLLEENVKQELDAELDTK